MPRLAPVALASAFLLGWGAAFMALRGSFLSPRAATAGAIACLLLASVLDVGGRSRAGLIALEGAVLIGLAFAAWRARGPAAPAAPLE